MKLLILSGDESLYSLALAVMESSKKKNADVTLLRLSEIDSAYEAHRRSANKSRPRLSGYQPHEIFDRAFFERLEAVIREGGFEGVVCADMKAVKAASHIKRQIDSSVKFYGVLTDTGVVQSLSGDSMDGFFIPHQSLIRKLRQKGLDGEFYPTGVPVEKGFFRRFSKKAARNYLVIPQNKRVYLLLSDGIGYEEIRDVCDEMLHVERESFVFYIFVRRGSEKGELLRRRYQKEERIRIITINKQLSVYMECADVMLTRPEGYESFEAAAVGVPMVHLMTVRGPAATAEFFSSQEMSLMGNSVSDAVKKARRLIEETAQARRMIKRQSMLIGLDAADKMIDKIMNQQRVTQGR